MLSNLEPLRTETPFIFEAITLSESLKFSDSPFTQASPLPTNNYTDDIQRIDVSQMFVEWPPVQRELRFPCLIQPSLTNSTYYEQLNGDIFPHNISNENKLAPLQHVMTLLNQTIEETHVRNINDWSIVKMNKNNLEISDFSKNQNDQNIKTEVTKLMIINLSIHIDKVL